MQSFEAIQLLSAVSMLHQLHPAALFYVVSLTVVYICTMSVSLFAAEEGYIIHVTIDGPNVVATLYKSCTILSWL